MLRCLACARDEHQLQDRVQDAVALLRRRLAQLRAGRVDLQDLLVGKKLSKELQGYRVPSHGALAVM